MSEKGFFAASISTLHEIIDKDGDAGHLFTYLVLAKHTNGRGANAHRISTAGAKAVANRTGITYHKAEVYLEWLRSNGFITKPEEVLSVSKFRAMQPRWILSPLDSERAYLPHSLVDGIGKGKNNPPLKRLWDETQNGKAYRKLMDSRADALLLLVHLYKEQSIQDYGGVNPCLIRRPWNEVEELPELLGSFIEDEVFSVGIMEIERSEYSANSNFINNVFSKVLPEERVQVFWAAFNNLHSNFIYEVLEVWCGNPLVDEKSELHYPLYILDYHARQTEIYCLKETHNLLRNDLDGGNFDLLLKEANESGRFRLVKTESGNSCVIGTIRMRYRPHTKEIAQGFDYENRRAEQWIAVLGAAH